MLNLVHYVYDHLLGRHAMPLAIAASFMGILLAKIPWFKKYLDRTVKLGVIITFTMLLITTIGYMFYPSYGDHVEATVATLGAIFLSGGQVYPKIPDPTLHAMMYGPGLYALQALAQSIGLPIIEASKVPGILALGSSILLLFKIIKNNVARSYLLLIVPFGIYLFWTRADPFFLLVVVVSLYISNRSHSLAAVIILGCLAGFASSLKIHAGLYVVAVTATAWPMKDVSLSKVTGFLIGVMVLTTITFMPEPVSFPNYVVIINLASKHGLLLRNFLESCFYLLGMSLPTIFVLISNSGLRNKYLIRLVYLLILELVVAAIGSKPGSGVHHLMPFIPMNAYLLERVLDSDRTNKVLPESLKYGALALCIAGLIQSMTILSSIKDSYVKATEMRSEVETLVSDYSEVILGITDNETYDYTFFSPVLQKNGFQQIDYASYMDLNFSGVSDEIFALALASCRYRYVALPKMGEPFSMLNSFTSRPLFSDNVRAQFAKHFQKTVEKKYYDIYLCQE